MMIMRFDIGCSVVGVVYHLTSTYQNSQTSTMEDVLGMVSIFFSSRSSMDAYARRSKVRPSWRLLLFLMRLIIIILIDIDIDIDIDRGEHNDALRTGYNHVHRFSLVRQK